MERSVAHCVVNGCVHSHLDESSEDSVTRVLNSNVKKGVTKSVLNFDVRTSGNQWVQCREVTSSTCLNIEMKKKRFVEWKKNVWILSFSPEKSSICCEDKNLKDRSLVKVIVRMDTCGVEIQKATHFQQIARQHHESQCGDETLFKLFHSKTHWWVTID